MNKKLFVLITIFCFFLIGVNFSIFAQSSNNEQRLIGTWTSLHNSTHSLVFNANGTMTVVGITYDDFVPTHWAAAGDTIILFIPNRARAIRLFNISNDGRTLIIIRSMSWENELGGMAFRRN